MARKRKRKPAAKPLQWRLECFGHSLIEIFAGLLPGPWVFRLGERFGGLVWYFMPMRRKTILRNLRIAFAGEKTLPELRRMAKATFRRTAGNLVSATYTARLSPEKLSKVIHIENRELLEQALAGGKGVVLLLAHMGNWELLSRLVHLFPPGSKTGAFYRPLNNPLLDAQVLARRQADGTRMFSKRENALQVAGFLREGGIVGILADQRVGPQGELVPFFGRVTRASPLPSLLARRSKSEVLALSLITERPGKWKAVFTPVPKPPTTVHCMPALEAAMKASPIDVFWLQERWKIFLKKRQNISDWLGPDPGGGEKLHRALIWLSGAPESWKLPDGWSHPNVAYEAAIPEGSKPPDWLPANIQIHNLPHKRSQNELGRVIREIDQTHILPLDFIITGKAGPGLSEAASGEQIPLVCRP